MKTLVTSVMVLVWTWSAFGQMNLVADGNFEDLNCVVHCFEGSASDLRAAGHLVEDPGNSDYEISPPENTCPWKLWRAKWGNTEQWYFQSDPSTTDGGSYGLKLTFEGGGTGSFGLYQEFTVVYNGNPVIVDWDWRGKCVGCKSWWEVMLLPTPWNANDADQGGHPHVDQFVLEKWEQGFGGACPGASDAWENVVDVNGLPPSPPLPPDETVCDWPPDGNQRPTPDDGGSLQTWTLVLKCGGINPSPEAGFDNIIVTQVGNDNSNAPCEPLAGDIDADLDVDLDDFATFADCFGEDPTSSCPSLPPPCECAGADIDQDIDVDCDDFDTLLESWSNPPAPQDPVLDWRDANCPCIDRDIADIDCDGDVDLDDFYTLDACFSGEGVPTSCTDQDARSDIDGDTDVDCDDFVTLVGHWTVGDPPASYENCPCYNKADEDFDCDGDVDLIDFATFQTCYSDEGGGIPSGPPYDCGRCDLNGDGSVDQTDLMAFTGAYTGPN